MFKYRFCYLIEEWNDIVIRYFFSQLCAVFLESWRNSTGKTIPLIREKRGKKISEIGKRPWTSLPMVMQPSIHRGLPRKDARASVHHRFRTPSRSSQPFELKLTFIVFPKKEKQQLSSVTFCHNATHLHLKILFSTINPLHLIVGMTKYWEIFGPKLQYFLSFKYIEWWSSMNSKRRRIITYGSLVIVCKFFFFFFFFFYRMNLKNIQVTRRKRLWKFLYARVCHAQVCTWELIIRSSLN